ncbi:uncharacterized protein RP689-like [Lineus longissimus]|uniref:uncharacterized protein RP689-like n=1 Tax=Lineus longissimus TaxID=88925 RepID=UPI002B4CCEA1
MDDPWYMKKWKKKERDEHVDQPQYQYQNRDQYGHLQYQYQHHTPGEEAAMRRLTFKRLFFVLFLLFCLRLMFRSMYMLNVQHRKGQLMYISQTCMTDHERKVLQDIFHRFYEVANKHNVTYFLHYGSLLGSWRHHGMIPWDDDMDVAVHIRDRGRIMQIFDPADNADYIAFDTGDPSRGLKFYSNQHSVMIPQKVWKWPFLDISFYDDNQTHIWDTYGPDSHRKFLKNEVFPLRKRPFEGVMVNCPRNPLYVIRKLFGDENVCAASKTNHMHELRHPEVVRVDCHELRDRLEFVERHDVNGKIYEKYQSGVKLIYEDNHVLRQHHYE